MTAYGLSIRFLLKEKGDPKTFAFITTFIGSLSLLLVLPFEEIKFNFDIRIIFILLILGASYALTDFLFIMGRKLEEISIVSTFVQAGNVWALIGGILLFSETLSAFKLSGVFLIILGNVLIAWKGNKITLSKGIILISIGVFLFSVNSLVDKSFAASFSPSFYKFFLIFIESIVLFFAFSQNLTKIKKEFKIHGLYLLLVGPMIAYGTFFVIKAFQVQGEISKVLPIFSLSLPFSVILGIILLKEKEDIIKKIIAMLFVFSGSLLLISK